MDLVDDFVVLQGEVLGKNTGVLKGEDALEFIISEQEGAVSIMAGAGLDSEAAIEIMDVLRDKGVGCFDG